MVICIIAIIYILIRFSIWISGKVTDFASINPRAKRILIILALVFMAAGGYKLRELYYERPPYRFWNELVRSNSKAFNVSQEEFEAKNRAGYCWRDRKYYSKEELWHKAMKSLIGRMIYENKLYWDDEVIDAGGKPMPTGADCIRSNGCKVWRVPVKLTNRELQDYIGDEDKDKNKDDYLEKVNTLMGVKKTQTYTYASDKNYINDDYKLKNFILIHQNNNRHFVQLYGSDCCRVLSKVEWSSIRKERNYIFVTSKKDMGTFVEESKIPTNLNINSLGVGNFYFGVTNITAGSKYQPSKDPEEVFYLSNCGDVLYKPYYR